jgi:thioredoxin reductase (NADPH)
VSKPVILVVDDDREVLAAIDRDLRAHYKDAYRVIAIASGQAALATVRELKARAEALAMVLSDQRMPGMLGAEVLARTRAVYPLARRVLLTAYSDLDAVVRAVNDAHLDHYLSKPWTPPEECLYPVIDDLLDAWQAEYLPETKGLRLVGHQWSPRSHAIKDFLACNLVPYHWLDVERKSGAHVLLEAAGVGAHELPALFFEDGSVLRDPEPREVAERLGRSLSAEHRLYDLVIVGAGPAGLAAAVYAASEGLRTLLLDEHGPGGQAGSSSRIENYLGFPNGVSGSDLARRAITQAERLGAEFLVPLKVESLWLGEGYKRLTLSDGREIVSLTILIATGMAYREHPAEGAANYGGAGVYYGAATTEAAAFAGKRVIVVGGGNSAGQGAMYLSRFAADVQIVIRRDSLRGTMSQYLIEQIERTPNIHLRSETEVVRVEGREHVERVELRSTKDGARQPEAVDAVFAFIGTKPRSDWLPEQVLRDRRGFVLTGRDLIAGDQYAKLWKERREPFSLETSAPGVFAAGDVRSGAMNRVASAVGEGAMVVHYVHQYLAIT